MTQLNTSSFDFISFYFILGSFVSRYLPHQDTLHLGGFPSTVSLPQNLPLQAKPSMIGCIKELKFSDSRTDPVDVTLNSSSSARYVFDQQSL